MNWWSNSDSIHYPPPTIHCLVKELSMARTLSAANEDTTTPSS